MGVKPLTKSDLREEIHIKLASDDGPVVEFHNVSIIGMLAAIKFLEREVQRALFQIETEDAMKRSGGVIPFAGMPDMPDLKGRRS